MPIEACAALGAVPASSETVNDARACSHSWQASAWGAPSSNCSDAATQSRVVSCVRSDASNTVVDDSNCAGPKPDTVQTVSSTSGCSYGWQASQWGQPYNVASSPNSGTGWTTNCTTSLRQTRSVQCVRSDGTPVAASNCNAGTMPSPWQDQVIYTGCGYAWEAVGDWSAPVPACGATTQSQTVNCRRTNDNTIADQALCNPATKPSITRPAINYATCTYAWVAGSWGAWNSTCSDSATRTRTVQCQRSDGAFVGSGCNAATRPAGSETAGVYSSCSINWSASSWATPAGCGYVTSTRTVSCYNSSLGRNFSESYCNASSKPASTQSDYDVRSCTYAWNIGGWGGWNSHCSDSATRYRSAFCQRSDGANVSPSADYRCGAAPATSESAAVYSSCSIDWTTGGWSTPAGCGYVTSTRSVSCYNHSLGRTFPENYCNPGTRPGGTQTDYDIRSCSYSSSYGSLYSAGSCTNGSKTDTYYRVCTRSDGQTVDAGSYCGSYFITQSSSCGPPPETTGGGCVGGYIIKQSSVMSCLGQYYPSSCPDYYSAPDNYHMTLSQCESMGGNCVQARDTYWDENNSTHDGWSGTVYSCYGGSSGHYPWGALDNYSTNGSNTYTSTARF